MIVGIMSDSHGDAAATARAVALLKSLGAEHYIHCGDVCGENVLAEMAGYAFTFVWGNCDDVSPAIRKYVEGLEQFAHFCSDSAVREVADGV